MRLRKRTIAGLVISSFLALLGVIYLLMTMEMLRPIEAGLAAVALFGMYVGYGILIATWRLMNRLE